MEKRELGLILNDLGIEYNQQTDSALNVCCPFCPRPDTNYHLGIFYSISRFSCFRCGDTGSLFEYLKAVRNISWDDFRDKTKLKPKLEEMALSDLVASRLKKKEEEVGPTKSVLLPDCRQIDKACVERYPMLGAYLKERKLSLEICQEYEASFGGYVGEFAYRMILPIWDETGKQISYQARDITGQARAKYKSGHGCPINNYLYYSSALVAKSWDVDVFRGYLVEGIFDVWRMEHSAVASFGKQLSELQKLKLICDDSLDEIVVCWDADAYNKAEGVARELSEFKKVGVVRLPEGHDPDSLGEQAVRELPIRWMNGED